MRVFNALITCPIYMWEAAYRHSEQHRPAIFNGESGICRRCDTNFHLGMLIRQAIQRKRFIMRPRAFNRCLFAFYVWCSSEVSYLFVPVASAVDPPLLVYDHRRVAGFFFFKSSSSTFFPPTRKKTTPNFFQSFSSWTSVLTVNVATRKSAFRSPNSLRRPFSLTLLKTVCSR